MNTKKLAINQKVYYILIVFIFFSCNKSKKTEEDFKDQIHDLNYKIGSLQAKLKNEEKLNKQLISEKIKLLKEIDLHKEEIKNSIKKEDIELLLNDKYLFLVDKEKLITFVYDSVIKSNDPEDNINFQYRSLFHGFLEEVSDWEDTEPNFYEYASYILTKFSRTSKNLNNVFENNKDLIFKLLNKASSYSDSGLKLFVKGVILTYENSNKNDFKKLYNLSKKHEYGILLSEEDHYIFAKKLATEELKTLFNENNEHTIGEEIYSNFGSYAFQVYSFWGRRQYEGNAEIVYSILKEIDQNVN